MHLLYYRSDYMFAKAQVHGVNGLILFPDYFTIPSGITIDSPNLVGVACTSNTLSDADWSSLEQVGCVFLPVAGSRHGTDVENAGEAGFYWSSSGDSYYYEADYLYFDGSDEYSSLFPGGSFHSGFSVRLVRVI